jgi:hypothetical protein
MRAETLCCILCCLSSAYFTQHLVCNCYLVPDSKVTTTANAGMDVVKQEPLYTAGGNASQYNHYGKQYGDSSKN